MFPERMNHSPEASAYPKSKQGFWWKAIPDGLTNRPRVNSKHAWQRFPKSQEGSLHTSNKIYQAGGDSNPLPRWMRQQDIWSNKLSRTCHQSPASLFVYPQVTNKHQASTNFVLRIFFWNMGEFSFIAMFTYRKGPDASPLWHSWRLKPEGLGLADGASQGISPTSLWTEPWGDAAGGGLVEACCFTGQWSP